MNKDEVLVKIQWVVEDVAIALEDREESILTLAEAVEAVTRYADNIEERGIESGWEIIDGVISDAEQAKIAGLHA
ncbi:hypothetical protein UFOVP1313_56 [uncultured Caudovirales phage]|uniref:Uncharacterized protein n=1 Tax=uncultured Caudovirales phage TaxID=2100421 RepID=A0A6J5RX77_9CAUD|nr:hypothetical protein UFOVP1313_56 [uncultured Caudovirales phage]